MSVTWWFVSFFDTRYPQLLLDTERFEALYTALTVARFSG